MSDEPAPEVDADALPELQEIPADAIDRWSSLPDDQNLLLPIGRPHLDNLMVGLRQIVTGQIALGQSLDALYTGEKDLAGAMFRKHQELSRYAYSNVSLFITHIMKYATPEQK